MREPGLHYSEKISFETALFEEELTVATISGDQVQELTDEWWHLDAG